MSAADLVQILGGVTLSVGAFLAAPVVGVIVAGVLLIVFGVAMERS